MTTAQPEQASDSDRSRAENVFLIPAGINLDNLEALVGQPVLVDRRRVKYTPPSYADTEGILSGVGRLYYEMGPIEIGLITADQVYKEGFFFGVPVTKRMYLEEGKWTVHPNKWVPDLPFTTTPVAQKYIGGEHAPNMPGMKEVLVMIGTEAFERYFTKTVQDAWQSNNNDPSKVVEGYERFFSVIGEEERMKFAAKDRTEQILYVTAMDALGLKPNPAYVQDWAGRIVAEAYSNIKSQVEPEKMSLAAQQGIAALQPIWHMHRDAVVTAAPGEKTVGDWYYAFINITMRASSLKSSIDEL